MPAILISYDLNTPGQKYDRLYEAIKKQGAWLHLLDSAWIVSGPTLTAQRVYDALRPMIDTNDHIFCVNISGASRQGWLPKTSWNWINQNV
ncbi:hypothetical protein OMK64_01910 [Cellulomonas fimi]|uniref:hypothetical protein n=1 Tax=Cellulomonas fimi TaxID=1708 RepID=UPI00234D3BF8|nr:hypothetical protein [Cellulomonas fimi]MDC7120287.1 hypothetical protein [Cellulomonas fimi]